MTLEATSYRYEIMGSRDGIACQAKIEKTKIAVYHLLKISDKLYCQIYLNIVLIPRKY